MTHHGAGRLKLNCPSLVQYKGIHHSRVKGAATNTHWWSDELTANYLAMQVALDFNTERKAGVAFFIVF